MNLVEKMDEKHHITCYKGQFDVMDLIRTMQTVHEFDFEDPLYICDLSEINKALVIWKQVLPRVIPFYAVKCNTYPPLLELLAKLGVGFDCASAGEMTKIRSFGVKPHRIIFANTTKQISHILFAKEHGITKMTFDNECELLKIRQYYPKAELVLRIRHPAKEALVLFGDKFGCDTKTGAYDLIEKAIKLNMKVVGITFHVGSGCIDSGVFTKAIGVARKLFDYSAKLGQPMNFLDIGGGFLADTINFSQCASAINKGLAIYFPNNDVTVVSEPGRYIAAPAFTLITKVVNTRKIVVNRKPYFLYTINSGVHAGFSHMKYGAANIKPLTLKEEDEELFRCTIYGHTCDPSDKLYDNLLFPKLIVGDLVIFKNFGAYSLSTTTDFNGFEFPQIKAFINVKHEDISSQETWNRDTMV